MGLRIWIICYSACPAHLKTPRPETNVPLMVCPQDGSGGQGEDSSDLAVIYRTGPTETSGIFCASCLSHTVSCMTEGKVVGWGAGRMLG